MRPFPWAGGVLGRDCLVVRFERGLAFEVGVAGGEGESVALEEGELCSPMAKAVFHNSVNEDGEVSSGSGEAVFHRAVGLMVSLDGMSHGLARSSEKSEVGDGSSKEDTSISYAETESSRLWNCLGSNASYSVGQG